MGKKGKISKKLLQCAITLALALGCTAMLEGIDKRADKGAAYAADHRIEDGNDGGSVVLPSSYYLMNHGLSTPAKLQSPWGDCWAFAVASALESSILKKQSELVEEMNASLAAGQGGNGSVSEQGSGSGASSGDAAEDALHSDVTVVPADAAPLFNLASEKIDISERAIAWFAHELQTEASAGSQAGEGYYLLYPGEPRLQLAEGNFDKVTSLFNSGQAIVAETTIPYQYNNYDGNPLWYSLSSHNSRNDARLKDWSVADSFRVDPTLGWSVTEVEKLPSPALTTVNSMTGYTYYEGYDPTATAAIKDAIYETGAVAIALSADTSVPPEIVSGNFRGAAPSEYFTYSTWSQYDSSSVMNYNHAVSIVGWDDNYSAANFAGTVSGMPPGDGAWLCKNNWGSDMVYATQGNLGDALHWGLLDENGNASGYFWLSYYDHTIHDPISYKVAPADQGFDAIYQYDYLGSAEFSNPATYEGEVWTANLYTAKSAELIRAVSCETFNPQDMVTIEIFKLSPEAQPGIELQAEVNEVLPVNQALAVASASGSDASGSQSGSAAQASSDDASADPSSGSAAGEPEGSILDGLTPDVTTQKVFRYAGFHTVELEDPILITEGERFAIAMRVTQSATTNSPSVSDTTSLGNVSNINYLGLELAYLNPIDGGLQTSMANVVVNEGESFVSLRPGKWKDVVEFNASHSQANTASSNARTYGNALTKAYSDYTTMAQMGQIYKVEPLSPIPSVDGDD